jgi:hypothetical protein
MSNSHRRRQWAHSEFHLFEFHLLRVRRTRLLPLPVHIADGDFPRLLHRHSDWVPKYKRLAAVVDGLGGGLGEPRAQAEYETRSLEGVISKDPVVINERRTQMQTMVKKHW